MTDTDTARSTWHQQLAAAGQRADREAAKFILDTKDHHRARHMLTAMAGHCRAVVRVFDLDPTLVDDPYGTGRFRGIDLLLEMARQLGPLLAQACGTRVGRERNPKNWEEAEALFARAEKLAAAIPRVVPRLDHDTVEGSSRISRERLATETRTLQEAADSIHAACGAARLHLLHVDPLVDVLSNIAQDLNQIAATLEVDHDAARDLVAPSALLT